MQSWRLAKGFDLGRSAGHSSFHTGCAGRCSEDCPLPWRPSRPKLPEEDTKGARTRSWLEKAAIEHSTTALP